MKINLSKKVMESVSSSGYGFYDNNKEYYPVPDLEPRRVVQHASQELIKDIKSFIDMRVTEMKDLLGKDDPESSREARMALADINTLIGHKITLENFLYNYDNDRLVKQAMGVLSTYGYKLSEDTLAAL